MCHIYHLMLTFNRVNWIDWGGVITETSNIQQEMKSNMTRGGWMLGEPEEKGNPEHRGCMEDWDMDAETKIALCGHAAHFHFMSQYPFYAHTHPYSNISLSCFSHTILHLRRWEQNTNLHTNRNPHDLLNLLKLWFWTFPFTTNFNHTLLPITCKWWWPF